MEILKIYIEEWLLRTSYVWKVFTIAKNRKYDGYQRNPASMVDIFFDRKSSGSGVKSKIIKPRISWRITQTNY